MIDKTSEDAKRSKFRKYLLDKKNRGVPEKPETTETVDIAPDGEYPDTPYDDEENQKIIDEAENLDAALEEFSGKEDSKLKSAIRAYSIYLKKYPRITPERERELGRLIRRGDPQEAEAAFKELTEANLRLVVACVRRMYERAGNDSILDYLDMIQEGNIGLMVAVSKFNPDMGTRFSTYGVIWIRNAIERAIFKHKPAFSIPSYAGWSLYTLAPHIRSYLEGRESDIPKDKLRRVCELSPIARSPIFIDHIEDPSAPGTIPPETLTQSDPDGCEDEKIANKIDGDIDRDVASVALHKAFLDVFTEEEYHMLCKRHGLGYYQSMRPCSLKKLSSDLYQSAEFTRLQVKYIEDVLKDSSYLKEVWSGCARLI